MKKMYRNYLILCAFAVLAITSNVMAYHVDWSALGGHYVLVSPSNIDVAYETTGDCDNVWRYSDWSAFPSLISYNFWEVLDYEDCPRAKMTTGNVIVPSKKYNVYVIVSLSNDWDGTYAAIFGNELKRVTLYGATEFSKSVDPTAESLYKFPIGTLTGASSISVAIDDYDYISPSDGIMRISYVDGTGENSRFVGVAWEEVVLDSCADVWNAGQGMSGDLNKDCKVDMSDLAIFANDWFGYSEYYQASFDSEFVRQEDILATQDTSVSSFSPDANDGSSNPQLTVSPDGSIVTYLQFDLTNWSIPTRYSLSKVFLKLVNTNTLPNRGAISVHQANSTSWNESTMTWNNQPGYQTASLDTAAPEAIQYFDITDLFVANIGQLLSLAITCDTVGGDSGKCYYASTENSLSGDGPTLKVFTQQVADFGEQWVRSHDFTITGWVIDATKVGDTNKLNAYSAMGLNTLLTMWPTAVENAKDNDFFWHLHFDQGPAIDWSNWTVGDNEQIGYVESLSTPDSDGGCYIKDEPSTDQLEGIGRFASWLRVNRPNWLIYVNTPSGFFSHFDGEPYLTEVMEIVKPDVLVYDVYPFVDEPSAIHYGETAIDKLFQNMMIIRNKAKEYNVPYFGYIQSTQIDPYGDEGSDYNFGPYLPSESELRMGIFAHLTAGYKGIYYFTYDADGGVVEAALTMPDCTPSTLGNYAAIANSEAQILGNKLVKLTSDSVYFVPGRTNSITHTAPSQLTNWSSGAGNGLITNVTVGSGQDGNYKDGLIGFFTDKINNKYFMLTNLYHRPWLNSSSAALNFVVTFDSSVNQIWRLNRQTGLSEAITLVNHQLNLSLPGGTGDLFSFSATAFE